MRVDLLVGVVKPTLHPGNPSTILKRRSFIELKDNRLTIKTGAFVSPFLGKEIVATLVWERIK